MAAMSTVMVEESLSKVGKSLTMFQTRLLLVVSHPKVKDAGDLLSGPNGLHILPNMATNSSIHKIKKSATLSILSTKLSLLTSNKPKMVKLKTFIEIKINKLDIFTL